MVLSETERVTLLIMREYGDLVRFEQITVLFNTTYPDRKLILKFTENSQTI